MAAIFFDRRRFSKAAEGHFWLSETPDAPGSRGWDAALPRSPPGSDCVLREERGRLLLREHSPRPRGSGSRIESARLLERKLGILCAGVPVILAGDFNAPRRTTATGLTRADPRDCRPLPALTDTYRAARGSGGGARARAPSTPSRAVGKRADRLDPRVARALDRLRRDRPRLPRRALPFDHFP